MSERLKTIRGAQTGTNMISKRKWAKLALKVNTLVDGLGKPIDAGIKEMVITMMCHGFETTASCEGHVERSCCYPWIHVNKSGRLARLLDKFYDSRMYVGDSRLTLKSMGDTVDRLQGTGGFMLDSLPREILTEPIRRAILARYTIEMNDFCAFLKKENYER